MEPKRIRVKVQICFQPALAKPEIHRRLSELTTSVLSSKRPIDSVSDEYGQLLVRKQFLLITSPLEHLFDVKIAIQNMYSKLYPEENPIDILRLRDVDDCDLDDEYLIGKVCSGDLIIKTVCEFGVIEPCVHDVDASKKQELRQPKPRVPNICRLVTPVSTVDDEIREELFNQINTDLTAKECVVGAIVSSSGEYETDSEEEGGDSRVAIHGNTVFPSGSTPTVPVSTVKPTGIVPIDAPVVSILKSSVPKNTPASSAIIAPVVGKPAVGAPQSTLHAANTSAATSTKKESGEGGEESSCSSEYETDSEPEIAGKPVVMPVAKPYLPAVKAEGIKKTEAAKKASSSEYETESSESDSEGEKDEARAQPAQPVQAAQPQAPVSVSTQAPMAHSTGQQQGSSTDTSDTEDSTFRPTPIDRVKQPVTKQSLPLGMSSQQQNKKYGSHLFSHK